MEQVRDVRRGVGPEPLGSWEVVGSRGVLDRGGRLRTGDMRPAQGVDTSGFRDF